MTNDLILLQESFADGNSIFMYSTTDNDSDEEEHGIINMLEDFENASHASRDPFYYISDESADE